MNKTTGFTLVEVLVSMFILSMMAVVALSGFQHMIKARETQRAHETVLSSLSFAYTSISNDMAQYIDTSTPLAFTERKINFTRALAQHTDANPFSMANIQYTWEKGTLSRQMEWGTETTTQILLKKVRDIQWQWLSEDTWHDISVPLKPDEKIKAWKLTFTDPTVGDLVWIFTHP